MTQQIQQVEAFHNAFNIKNQYSPSLLSTYEYLLRWKLINEESTEYMEACESIDKVEILDALADQLYIVYGTILKHGMQDVIIEAFNRVHASNMSKLDENGHPIINGENGILDNSRPIGKVLKSKNYKPVDLLNLV